MRSAKTPLIDIVVLKQRHSRGPVKQMKINIILISICLLISTSSKAHIRFIDTESQLPIPTLNIYHETGTLIGFTDKNGVLQFLERVDVTRLLPMTISVQHISYITDTIPISTLDVQQVYEITPRTNIIDDVFVSAKSQEVIVLKGYYRSLETFDLQHKYFSDGIIEFYIPLLKGKPKYKLIDYRIFIDSAVVADYDSKMGPFFQIPRVTEMDSETLSNKLAELTQENSGTNRVRLKKDGQEVGYLTKSTDGGNLQFYIDKVLPDTVVKEKLFRIEARTLQKVHIENYASTMVDHITPFDLTSIYQNIVATIKRKSEYGHLPYEALNEFYVLERRYISSKEYKSIEKNLTKSIYKTPNKSSYSIRYWEDLGMSDIPAIPTGLKVSLGDSMRLVE